MTKRDLKGLVVLDTSRWAPVLANFSPPYVEEVGEVVSCLESFTQVLCGTAWNWSSVSLVLGSVIFCHRNHYSKIQECQVVYDVIEIN